MTVSLTELRQRLFTLADQVVDTGEPLIVMRRGVRLRLVREETPAPAGGRLARLKPQKLVIGPSLDPHESPAQWSEAVPARVAEPPATRYTPASRPKKPGRRDK